jgi:hypothetical protein
MLSRSITVALLWILASGPLAPAATRLPPTVQDAIQQVTADELRAHVTVLASDKLAGRGVGHQGNQQAENYIAAALKTANVAPAAAGYLQPVEVYQPLLGQAARLTVRAGSETLADLASGGEFFPLPESGDRAAAGPIVFAGYGLSAPDLKYDDYSRVKASGVIVMVMDGVPEVVERASSVSADDTAEMGSIDRKVHDARAHGAAGLLVIRPYPGSTDYFWPAHPSVRSATYRLYGEMRAQPLAVGTISAHAAGPIRRAAELGIAVSASFNPVVIARPIVIDNILGMIDGRQASQEMVIVGAHMDHDGIDESGRIYNGADDNASGTAAVLAIASAFARAAAHGSHPARTILFALWNGEEKGSLGAEFYVQQPVPARRIVADINLDMIGREEEIPDPNNPRYRGFEKTSAAQNTNVVHLLGYSYSPDLATLAERANEPVHLTMKEDYDRDAQGLVRRSDNWPFLAHGIPAVFLTTGLHPDYHTPDDDTDRIDFPKLERITELAARLAWMAAEGDAPRFKAR